MTPDSQTRLSFSSFDDNEKDGNYETYPPSDVVELYGMPVESLSEIVGLDLPTTLSLGEQAVSVSLRELCDEGALCMEEKKKKRYYYIPK
mgnify:CR=1 FL=1